MKSDIKDYSDINEIGSFNVLLRDDEIKNLSTLELLNLKNSVFNYLKCKKIKNRNHNFITVYTKISNEIISRNNDVSTTIDKKSIIFGTIKENKLNCDNIKTNIATNNLLGKKKFNFSNILNDVHFPSFLNDKIEFVKEPENNMNNLSSNDDKEISIRKMKIKTKKCLNGKLYRLY